MADDDLEELLEALAAVLDDVVAEAVGEDLARERGDGDAGALALEDVAKVLKVAVAAAHRRLAQLKRRDVGPAQDLVVRVHAAAHAVGSRVAHLCRESRGGSACVIYVAAHCIYGQLFRSNRSACYSKGSLRVP